MKSLLWDEYFEWKPLQQKCEKIYDYYRGKTDAINNYKMVTERSNIKINTNFLKKFVKEEVSYSVGNDVTYTSKTGNKEVIEDIDYYLEHWDEDHDTNLAKTMILYGTAYELYYIDGDNELFSKVISPRRGFTIEDEDNNILFFVYTYYVKVNGNYEEYIKVYDDKFIYYFDSSFNEIDTPRPHIFGCVPVGVAKLSDEGIYDTLYNDIKGLQDAIETNLSDISNEISDFRNAYLVFTGCEIEQEKAAEMKKDGIMQIPVSDGKVDWLIKNINDTFIQNTLSTLEDKMYQITSHINHNQRLQSNTSSLAIRSTLIALEEKCKLNQKALTNCLKKRLKILFRYLNIMQGKDYDFRDIKIKFTPNIPQDDLMIAQIISQLGDKLSTETALSLLSFIENPSLEVQKLKNELEEQIEGEKLLEVNLNE